MGRLASSGTLDNSFDAGLGSNNSLSAMALESNGRLILGGNFSTFDGVSRDGLCESTVMTPAAPGTTGLLDNGQVQLIFYRVGPTRYTIHASSDFAQWASLPMSPGAPLPFPSLIPKRIYFRSASIRPFRQISEVHRFP